MRLTRGAGKKKQNQTNERIVVSEKKKKRNGFLYVHISLLNPY